MRRTRWRPTKPTPAQLLDGLSGRQLVSAQLVWFGKSQRIRVVIRVPRNLRRRKQQARRLLRRARRAALNWARGNSVPRANLPIETVPARRPRKSKKRHYRRRRRASRRRGGVRRNLVRTMIVSFQAGPLHTPEFVARGLQQAAEKVLYATH